MRILIIGGLGTIGKALTENLSKKHEVYIADSAKSYQPNYSRVDISEFRQVEQLLFSHDFDYVYHLAAEFGRLNGEEFYENLWKTNVIGTKNILKLQKTLGFKLIFTSSSEVYGDYSGEITEDVMTKVPIIQLNDYAISKWVNELQIINSGNDVVRVRLFNNYGEGEYYTEYRSVICAFIYKVLHGIPIKVHKGYTRTFTYVADTIQTMANIVDIPFPSKQVFNIAGDSVTEMDKLAKLIISLCGKTWVTPQYEEPQIPTVKDKKVSNELAKKVLGYKTTVKLEEGLKRTIDWQKQVYRV